jgi:thioredoxin-related protein
VVEASKKLVMIYVDCTDRNKTPRDLLNKHGVTGFPAMIFVDSEANQVGKLGGRDSASVARQFNDIAEKHTKSAPWGDSLTDGLAAAAEDEKAVLLMFTDEKPVSNAVEEFFLDDEMEEILKSFTLVRHVIEKKCDTCKKFRARSGSAIHILDPADEDPTAKPVAKITGKKSVKDLVKSLERALKKIEKKRKSDE